MFILFAFLVYHQIDPIITRHRLFQQFAQQRNGLKMARKYNFAASPDYHNYMLILYNKNKKVLNL